MTHNSDINMEPPNSSAPQVKMVQLANKGMTREELMKKLSSNPRFKETPKSGEGFVIGGAKR